MAQLLFTCGYEGLTLETFIERLTRNAIRTVVDVRANPISRKKGFSKNAFSEALQAAGIAYLHAPALGCPKPIRDRYKQDQNWSVYTQGFLAYVKKQSDPLTQLASLSIRSNTCLVCFEADFNLCHRTYVARAVTKLNQQSVAHLTNQGKVVESTAAPAAA